MKELSLKICRVGIATAVLAVSVGIPTPVNAKITYTKDKFDVAFIGTYCRSSEPMVRISGNNKIKAEQFDLWPDIEITDDAVLEIE